MDADAYVTPLPSPSASVRLPASTPVTPLAAPMALRFDESPEGAYTAGSAFRASPSPPPSPSRSDAAHYSTSDDEGPVGGESPKPPAVMSAHPTGGKAYAMRHRKVLRPAVEGITNSDFRRLARRGGVKRMSAACHDTAREEIKDFLKNIIRDAVHYTEHSNRKTVCAMDVLYALKRNGRTLYGYGG